MWNILTLMQFVLEVFTCAVAGDAAGGLLLTLHVTGAATGGHGSLSLHGLILQNTAEITEPPPSAIIINYVICIMAIIIVAIV